MTITSEQLKETAERCRLLGLERKADALLSMNDYLSEKGYLTGRQSEYASQMINEFTDDVVGERIAQRQAWVDAWDSGDKDFLAWLDFLTLYYTLHCVQQRSNENHILWYKHTARDVRNALEARERVSCPINQIERLFGSKLYDKLRATYDATPMYSVGDLVCIRGTSKTFPAHRIIHYAHKDERGEGPNVYPDYKVAEGYKIALVAEVTNYTVACRQVHKTKGTTRLYKIVAFSGGQQDECWIEESEIKLVK